MENVMSIQRALTSLSAVALFLVCLPGAAKAQYLCAVTVKLGGKVVLTGQIRDAERPSTEQLWQTLQTLSLHGDGPTLKGDVLVVIDGAGEVRLRELNLVTNKYNRAAWVVAPADFERIMKIRKESTSKESKK
jgi:hypothetical protein